MIKKGAILVFLPETPDHKIAEAMLAINQILDPSCKVSLDREQMMRKNPRIYGKVDILGGVQINEFEEDHGAPVWYVP